MYFGRLPKLWLTATAKPSSSRRVIAPFRRCAGVCVVPCQQGDWRAGNKAFRQRSHARGSGLAPAVSVDPVTLRTRFTCQHGRPGLALRVHTAHQQEHELGEEIAMLFAACGRG
jgi:hypothetical protein